MNRDHVHFHPPQEYARRPRAPRRRAPIPAQPDRSAGQLDLALTDRQVRRAAAERHQCPACSAPVGQPCTRRPTWSEGKTRVPLLLYVHAERAELVTDADVAAVKDGG